MTLKTYQSKRNFKVTSEPPAVEGKPHRTPIFVVQEHHASTLHYDFRLEADGVLKSWAVTKEPVLDPSVRRLAVEVEDHPLAYAEFSGDIPEGEYGAGHVEIWDHGSYRNLMEAKEKPMTIAESIEAGHVEVQLDGTKLNGAFALIRMKGRGGRNWLLVKMKDDKARPGSAADEDETKNSGAARGAKGSRTGMRAPRKSAATAGRGSDTSRPYRGARPPRNVEFTSTDKIMFPAIGATKGDVLHFYERIADRLLPYLKNRPMTLERLPDGLTSKNAPHFWQKETPDYYPEWIPRIELETTDNRMVEYVLVNDRQTLLYLVNQGTITFHPWLSRVSLLDYPDFVLFDLDPGPRAFTDAIQVARQIRSVLRDRNVECWIKTSGKTGLHVLAPWSKRKGDYQKARDWALEVAGDVVEALPDIATIERRKSARKGRLYLDVMQNARGHHAVPPYVLRAVPDATVSTPIRWEELKDNLTPGKFDIHTVLRRIARQHHDPMAPLLG